MRMCIFNNRTQIQTHRHLHSTHVSESYTDTHTDRHIHICFSTIYRAFIHCVLGNIYHCLLYSDSKQL